MTTCASYQELLKISDIACMYIALEERGVAPCFMSLKKGCGLGLICLGLEKRCDLEKKEYDHRCLDLVGGGHNKGFSHSPER